MSKRCQVCVGPPGFQGPQGPRGFQGPVGPNGGYRFSDLGVNVGPRFIGQGQTSANPSVAAYVICQDTTISEFHVAVTDFPPTFPPANVTFTLLRAPCLASTPGVTASYGPFNPVPGFTQTMIPIPGNSCQFILPAPVTLNGGDLLTVQVTLGDPTLSFHATASVC